MASRIPPLLESCLALPPETSQILLTGILGASTNWLVLRFLYSFLRPAQCSTGADDAPEAEVNVLLLSFLRDYAFWKDGVARLGIDLESLGKKGRFRFLDGLSHLFLNVLRGTPGTGPAHRDTMKTPRVDDIAQALNAAVDQLRDRGSKVVLIIDQLDLLLAATGDEIASTSLRDLILDLRQKIHASVLTLAVDEPLVSAQITTLEKEHAAFVLSLAHDAEAVLSLRLLETGAAKDVSGVIRITRGGEDLGRAIGEHEFLYHIGGDGHARVFERG